jgi:hypothetical protein
LAGLFLCLSSCHSRYLSIKIDICRSPVWNNEKTAVAFMAAKIAYRPASGISKIPDGGTAEIKYQDVSLYYFNLQDRHLVKVDSFTDLTQWVTAWKTNYDIDIAFTDTLIYYKVNPEMWRLKKADAEKKSLRTHAIIEKYNKYFVYDINTRKIREADSLMFNKVFNRTGKSNEISYNKLKSLLKGISLSDWGIILKDIYPQSDADYIRYIVYNQGNHTARQAIMAQVIPTLDKKRIKDMLEKMDEYKKKLKKKEKSSYDDHVRKLNYDKYYREIAPKLSRFL